MQTQHHPNELGPIYTGRRVLDVHGLQLGTITQVVYGDDPYEPEYLVVDPGLLRRPHYVPVAGACQTPDGEIVVSWDRDWFRLAPKASSRPFLTRSQAIAVANHYARR